jgi:hypothetical protein
MAIQRAFARGERVKLQEAFARALMAKRDLDWLKRRGTVTYCSPQTVYVRWDGRNTLDNLPIKGVEHAEQRE